MNEQEIKPGSMVILNGDQIEQCENAVQMFDRAIQIIVEGAKRAWKSFMEAIKPLLDWCKSTQGRWWMRRAGIIQPRRKQISTKRAMIYQRKMGIAP